MGTPGSFRPISLLSTLSKILERIIKNRLSWLSQNSEWISPKQHGFEEGKSTIPALHELITTIEDGFNGKQQTLAIFLGIAGAFDNAWPPSIIHTLIQRRCPKYLVNMISSFFSNRQITISSGCSSKSKLLTKRCPQGSVLSPFLWNIAIDDALRQEMPPSTKIQAFADDIAIYSTGNDVNVLQRNLQDAVSRMNGWCKSRLLKLSPSKSELVLFSNKQKINCNISIEIDGQQIDRKDEVKYLGLILHRKLNWKKHITTKI